MTAILIVDDSTLDRRLVAGLLKTGIDCSLLEATDGKHAIQQIETLVPDVILTDLQMPEMDGLELVERVRDEYPAIPVILMTAQGSEDIAALALKRGASSYVPKKRLAQDLIPTVRRILQASQQERTHSRLMHQLAECSQHFHLHNDPTLIAPLVRMIQEMLRCVPLGDEAERLRAGLAVEEALKNSLYHGNLEIGDCEHEGRSAEELATERTWMLPYCNRRIDLQINVSRTEAVFTIKDEGPGFDFSKYETDEFDADDPRGRGIRLMRTFMDDIQFEDKGRQVVLRKRSYEDATDDE